MMDRTTEFTLSVAGFPISVRALFSSTRDYCAAFLTDLPARFHITVTGSDLTAEQAWLDEEADREGLRRRKFGDPFLERNFLQRRIAALLLDEGVLLLHGSAVALDGRGYLFTAGCGTGKSTHARLWRETLGAVAVNDDKPFLRLTTEGVLLCGSPWQGKHGIGQNITVPLAGICLLRRGQHNTIRPITLQEAAPLLLSQLCLPEEASALPPIARKLLESTALWQLECTISPEAARVAYTAMGGRKEIDYV